MGVLLLEFTLSDWLATEMVYMSCTTLLLTSSWEKSMASPAQTGHASITTIPHSMMVYDYCSKASRDHVKAHS